MGIHTFLYKNLVRVLPLAMVDDILGIEECGNKSRALNTFINTHIERRNSDFTQQIPQEKVNATNYTWEELTSFVLNYLYMGVQWSVCRVIPTWVM